MGSSVNLRRASPSEEGPVSCQKTGSLTPKFGAGPAKNSGSGESSAQVVTGADITQTGFANSLLGRTCATWGASKMTRGVDVARFALGERLISGSDVHSTTNLCMISRSKSPIWER
jgi:hypothetical protein